MCPRSLSLLLLYSSQSQTPKPMSYNSVRLVSMLHSIGNVPLSPLVPSCLISAPILVRTLIFEEFKNRCETFCSKPTMLMPCKSRALHFCHSPFLALDAGPFAIRLRPCPIGQYAWILITEKHKRISLCNIVMYEFRPYMHRQW